jgi:nucleoid DNA-binding protein
MDIVKDLDRTELERQVAAELGCDAHEVHTTLSAFFKFLANGVAVKGYAHLHELGSFKLREIAARDGKLPDGTLYSAPKRVTVEFNPFKEVRETVEAVTGVECIL